jgi:hypothetical protein
VLVGSMIDRAFAQRFAEEWIAAWNAHDLDRILAHYTGDFAMSSPVIVSLAGEASGRLHGKPQIGPYWAEALRRYPDLKFELVGAMAGVDTITICYRGRRGLAAEVLQLGDDGKVTAAWAHYA